MNESSKFGVSIGFSILATFLCVIFYMLAGISLNLTDSSTNSEIFVRIAWTLGLIGVVAFLSFIFYGIRYLRQESNDVKVDVFFGLVILLLYAVPIGFVKSWYDNGFGWISFLLMLIGSLPLLIGIVISFWYALDEGETFFEKVFIILFYWLILTLWGGFPWYFVIYYKEIYFQHIFVGWFERIPAINASFIFSILLSLLTPVLIYYFYRIIRFRKITKEIDSEPSSVGETYNTMDIDSFSEIAKRKLDIEKHKAEEYRAMYPVNHYIFNHNYIRVNILIGFILILFSVFGISYLMNQEAIFSARNPNSLIITETVWILMCISIPLYHLYFARKARIYAYDIEKTLIDNARTVDAYDLKLHMMELEETFSIKENFHNSIE